MNQTRQSTLGVGVLLILLGILFLAGQVFPALFGWIGEFTWPLIIVGVSVLLLVIGLLTGTPDMVVPACIVGGIGLLLYWQNMTGRWESWAYAWTLIPGFAGVGTILAGLFKGQGKQIQEGAWTVLISLILFGLFGSFLGGPAILGRYWPVLLILLGLLSLGQYLLRSQRQA